MKKVRKKILLLHCSILVYILSAFGFNSCKKNDEPPDIQPMYGAPVSYYSDNPEQNFDNN